MQNKFTIGGIVAVIVLAGFWYFSGDEDKSVDIIVSPQQGHFEVRVVTTGELQAKNATEIMGPQGARSVGVWNMKIQRMIPEGTVVDSGDFVAELDKSELLGKIQDGQLQLQKVESQFTQTKLDTSLTLSQARDELINLSYAMEERKLEMEQSRYESPSVQRQAEINYEKSKRAYAQAKSAYKTRVLQAEAQIAEVQADLQKEQNKMKDYERIMSEFNVKAPKSGMVVYKREWNGKKRNVGSTVSPWDPVVAELPDLSQMESLTYINEVDIQKIKEGQQVDIGLDAMPDKELSGEVTSVANIGEERPNTDSKVFEVKININEVDTTLRPAMTTSNEILVYEADDVLSIPLESVYSTNELTYVFKKDGLGMARQQVALGQMNENAVIVRNGLSETDNIYLSMPADTSGLPWNYLNIEDQPVASAEESE